MVDGVRQVVLLQVVLGLVHKLVLISQTLS